MQVASQKIRRLGAHVGTDLFWNGSNFSIDVLLDSLASRLPSLHSRPVATTTSMLTDSIWRRAWRHLFSLRSHAKRSLTFTRAFEAMISGR